jgi:hypothetical protein
LVPGGVDVAWEKKLARAGQMNLILDRLNSELSQRKLCNPIWCLGIGNQNRRI